MVCLVLYIEKWMHLITIKNMLLLAVVSAIITDLGLYILIANFLQRVHFLKHLFGRL